MKGCRWNYLIINENANGCSKGYMFFRTVFHLYLSFFFLFRGDMFADTNIEVLAILRRYFKIVHKARIKLKLLKWDIKFVIKIIKMGRKIQEVEGHDMISDRIAEKGGL